MAQLLFHFQNNKSFLDQDGFYYCRLSGKEERDGGSGSKCSKINCRYRFHPAVCLLQGYLRAVGKTNLSQFRTVSLFSFPEITSFTESSKFICIFFSLLPKIQQRTTSHWGPHGQTTLLYTFITLPPGEFWISIIFLFVSDIHTLCNRRWSFDPYSGLKNLKLIQTVLKIFQRII